MSSVISRYASSKLTSPTTCEPKPQPCSICGQLECSCRPRFFAGQVLTADDLNRLDDYIRGKNRLHNRQLHGWGVVNGLEVTCDPCAKGVVVGCGYALSPCGDDIVVCEPALVDVCALVKACRQAERLTRPCTPFQNAQPGTCDEGLEWVLAIRYTETPTRSVKPLMSGKVGCSTVGSSGTNQTASTSKPRAAPVQCEPTIICEGFEFEVYRKPVAENDSCGKGASIALGMNWNAELIHRFECCMGPLLLEFAEQTQPTSTSDYYQQVCDTKDLLHRYLISRPAAYDCDLLTRLNSIVCPATPDTIKDSSWHLGLIASEILMASCGCSALLPPCPAPALNSRVPIATFTISADSCRVLSVCNWTHHRKIAITLPALQYWFDILPFGAQARYLLEQFCCMPPLIATGVSKKTLSRGSAIDEGPQLEKSQSLGNAAEYLDRARKRMNPQVTDPKALADIASLLRGVLSPSREALDPQTIVESFFLPEEAQTAAHLSSVEKANLPQFLLLNQILGPLIRATFGSLKPNQAQASETPAPTAQEASNAVELQQQIAALQARLDAQEKTLSQLSKRKSKGG